MTEQYYQKYIVQKADGTLLDPDADYFVLRIDKPENLYERRALWFYADCIAHDKPQLHADIKNRISEHDSRIAKEELEANFDCGFVTGQGCDMEGTEECDYVCPWRDRLLASPHYPNCDLRGNEANDPDEE